VFQGQEPLERWEKLAFWRPDVANRWGTIRKRSLCEREKRGRRIEKQQRETRGKQTESSYPQGGFPGRVASACAAHAKQISTRGGPFGGVTKWEKSHSPLEPSTDEGGRARSGNSGGVVNPRVCAKKILLAKIFHAITGALLRSAVARRVGGEK